MNIKIVDLFSVQVWTGVVDEPEGSVDLPKSISMTWSGCDIQVKRSPTSGVPPPPLPAPRLLLVFVDTPVGQLNEASTISRAVGTCGSGFEATIYRTAQIGISRISLIKFMTTSA